MYCNCALVCMRVIYHQSRAGALNRVIVNHLVSAAGQIFK